MRNVIKAFGFFLICFIGYNTFICEEQKDVFTNEVKYFDNFFVYEEGQVLQKPIEEESDELPSDEPQLEETILPIVEEYNEQNSVIEEPKSDNKAIIIEADLQNINIEHSSQDEPIIEEIVGSISGYGPDCYGCYSNKTASGYYIGEGNIYYEDEDYGKVRIVAADSKYPFGTIIKIKNYADFTPFYAIVLDRGGAIGLNKRIQFDLLYEKESDAIPYGIKTSVVFDVVRLGY